MVQFSTQPYSTWCHIRPNASAGGLEKCRAPSDVLLPTCMNGDVAGVLCGMSSGRSGSPARPRELAAAVFCPALSSTTKSPFHSCTCLPWAAMLPLRLPLVCDLCRCLRGIDKIILPLATVRLIVMLDCWWPSMKYLPCNVVSRTRNFGF